MSKKNHAVPLSFFDRMESYLQKKEWLFFWIIFALTALVAMLLYDPRVSLTGDDSTYIQQANNFIRRFSFPNYQGPLYPIALSLFVLVFGVSLFPLKLFSLLAMLGFVYFTFVAFRKRIPYGILFPVLLLVSINSFMLYYASQTYSETFYMFMQSLVLYVVFRYFIDRQAELPLKQMLKPHLWLALSILGVALSRSVGFSVIIAVGAYFLFYKDWKNLGLSLLCFFGLFVVYSVLKTVIWGNSDLQFSGQASSLLQKNFYRPEEGQEDFIGLLVRFWQNSVQYLSNGLWRIMGFHYQVGDNSVFRTLLVYATAIATLCFSYKRNRYVFFTVCLAGVFLLVTFVVLQVFWNQERLIIPVYPFIIMSVLACLYFILSLPKLRNLQFLYLLPIVVLLATGLRDTGAAIPEARKLTNQYSGLTPDWVHYLKAGDWAEKHLAPEDLVACRKPSISAIYANGKSFYGIYSVPNGSSKALMDTWRADAGRFVAVPMTQKTYPHYASFLYRFYYARIELGNGTFWLLNNVPELHDFLLENEIEKRSLAQVENLARPADDKFGVFYADSLLVPFREKGVTHLMTASLRVNPAQKTGQTISTVERYAFYIQEKYPDIFEFIYQEGKDADEPARLFKINWEVTE